MFLSGLTTWLLLWLEKLEKLENVMFFKKKKKLEKLEKVIISPQYQLEKLDFMFCTENESEVMNPKLFI